MEEDDLYDEFSDQSLAYEEGQKAFVEYHQNKKKKANPYDKEMDEVLYSYWEQGFEDRELLQQANDDERW